ncbi:MAG: hypothetical protein M1814_001168 [Vezdaea aestivalis]|nr:MAG: hypothetical protein M1814_001168 [Vezdaea aestivalis]
MTTVLASVVKRVISRLQTHPITTTRDSLRTLASGVLIEELNPDYNSESFYPVNPGDCFNDRYQVVTKLGWGSSSTVWLARDLHRWRWQPSRYVTLKINTCDFDDSEGAEHELNISRRLATNPSHEGFPYVRTVIDTFKVAKWNDMQVCLVFEPMREPLWRFQQRCKNRKFPLDLLRGYIELLLKGLDYIHSQCQVVHTDLKLDNILVGFEEQSVIEDFVRAQAESPMSRKNENDRSVYRSHNDFGPLRSFYILPQITDFGLAQRGDGPQPQIHPIQPDHYRAPEVVLGAGWTYSADIWNLGVMIWNLMEGKDLFKQIHSDRGQYSGQAHIAEMIALLGHPPKELARREAEERKWKWRPAIENAAGKLCETASEFYGGPFFNVEGKLSQPI